MESLNPVRPPTGDGLQLDFAAEAEEYPFSKGTLTPLLGLGLGMSTAAMEKEVGASGFPGGVTRQLYLCLWCCFLHRMKEMSVVVLLGEI
jgi:hypothetical protein